jgi:hypothetical protein
MFSEIMRQITSGLFFPFGKVESSKLARWFSAKILVGLAM